MSSYYEQFLCVLKYNDKYDKASGKVDKLFENIEAGDSGEAYNMQVIYCIKRQDMDQAVNIELGTKDTSIQCTDNFSQSMEALSKDAWLSGFIDPEVIQVNETLTRA